MNRQMRRLADKYARRGTPPPAERVVPLPSLLDEFTVFDHIDTMLQKICNKLHYSTVITERDLKLANATNAMCKAVFRQRRKEITEIAKLAQFKILLGE